MSDWTKTARQGYRTKTLQSGSATIIIHRPELSKEERSKREQQAKRDMEAALRGYLNRTGQRE